MNISTDTHVEKLKKYKAIPTASSGASRVPVKASSMDEWMGMRLVGEGIERLEGFIPKE